MSTLRRPRGAERPPRVERTRREFAGTENGGVTNPEA